MLQSYDLFAAPATPRAPTILHESCHTAPEMTFFSTLPFFYAILFAQVKKVF